MGTGFENEDRVAKAKKVMQRGMGEIRNPQRRNLMYFV